MTSDVLVNMVNEYNEAKKSQNLNDDYSYFKDANRLLDFIKKMTDAYDQSLVKNLSYAKHKSQFLWSGLVLSAIVGALILILEQHTDHQLFFAGAWAFFLFIFGGFYMSMAPSKFIPIPYEPYLYGAFLDEKYQNLVNYEVGSAEFVDAQRLFQVLIAKDIYYLNYNAIQGAQDYLETLTKTNVSGESLKVEVQ